VKEGIQATFSMKKCLTFGKPEGIAENLHKGEKESERKKSAGAVRVGENYKHITRNRVSNRVRSGLTQRERGLRKGPGYNQLVK